MAIDPNLVADRLIEISHAAGKPLTQIEIHKLLYFVEGWHLALVGEPLFDEEFRAWKLGPVIPAIYDRLKRYGTSVIPRGEAQSRGIAALGDRLSDLIQRVFITYKEREPGGMLGLTRLPGTPWLLARESQGLEDGDTSQTIISKASMRAWFSAVLRTALEPAGDDVVIASPDEYADWTLTAALHGGFARRSRRSEA